VIATAATVLLLPAPLAATADGLAGLATRLAAPAKAAKPAAGKRTSCPDRGSLRPLAALPAQTLFAPLDIGPDLLLDTPHSVIATGHHRNAAAMDRVIAAYLAAPEEARRIVLASPATLIVICPRLPEMGVYRKRAPGGLAARLVADRPPAWLVPVPQPAGSQIRVWRIVRTAD
jgi:hypothetical protein